MTAQAEKRTISLHDLTERSDVDQIPVGEDVNELTEKIRKNGFLESEPVAVCRDSINGKYIILDGVKRSRAARNAGLNEVPCMVFSDANAFQESLAVHGDPITLERAKAMTFKSSTQQQRHRR